MISGLSLIIAISMFIVGMGAGFLTGKAVTEKEVYNTNIQNITTISHADAYAVSGTISVIAGEYTETIAVKVDRLIKVKFLIVSNGITNHITNYIKKD